MNLHKERKKKNIPLRGVVIINLFFGLVFKHNCQGHMVWKERLKDKQVKQLNLPIKNKKCNKLVDMELALKFSLYVSTEPER